MQLTVLRLLAVFVRQWLPRTSAPHKRIARARIAVLAFVPTFILVLMGAWVVAEALTPEITDTDYHLRLRIARTAQAEHPNQPLGIVLGSSRMVWAFEPEQMPQDSPVCWVNAAHITAGPTFNRVILHRLLRDGIQPDVVVLEVMPTFFVKENNRFMIGYFAAHDMPLARQYSDRSLGFDAHFLRHRLLRATDLARVTDPFAGQPAPLPRGGYRFLEPEITAAERVKRTAFAKQMYGAHAGNMTMRPNADRAFRDTIREAQEHGIRVVLLRSSEGPTFRSWYNPQGLVQFDRYIAGVAKEYGVPVVDARLWLDEEDFVDSHHVLKRGADKFTARFARELSPLVGGH